MLKTTTQYKSYLEADKKFVEFMGKATSLIKGYEKNYSDVFQNSEKNSLEKSFNILNSTLEDLKVTDQERFQLFNALGKKLKEFTDLMTPSVVVDKANFAAYNKVTDLAVKACELQGSFTTRSTNLSKNIDLLKTDLVAERKHVRSF